MNSSIEGFLARHQAWPSVKAVVETLARAGHQVVLAGGCVRDGLLGRPFSDFDVATSATPDQVEACFERTVAVGKAFGVIMVVLDGHTVEVATFRKDADYKDGRHPSSVEFSDLKQDALRRDFTVNALFYDPLKKNVMDYVQGLADLKRGIIRAVGNPQERFREDRLRLLRAVRFAAQLKFEIETETWNALTLLSSGINQVARERQKQELRKLALSSDSPRGWILLEKSRLLKHLLPNLAELVELKTPEWVSVLAGLCRFENSPPLDIQLAWIHFSLDRFNAEPSVIKELKSLKATQKELQQARAFLQGLKALTREDLSDLERLQLLAGPVGPWLADFWPYAAPHSRPLIDETMAHLSRVIDKNGELPAPLLVGADLLDLGFSSGPKLGELLKQAYSQQLMRGWERPRLLRWARELKAN